jgi:hypothetical protein
METIPPDNACFGKMIGLVEIVVKTMGNIMKKIPRRSREIF